MDAASALLHIKEYADKTDKALKEANTLEGWASISARTLALSEFFGYASHMAAHFHKLHNEVKKQ